MDQSIDRLTKISAMLRFRPRMDPFNFSSHSSKIALVIQADLLLSQENPCSYVLPLTMW